MFSSFWEKQTMSHNNTTFKRYNSEWRYVCSASEILYFSIKTWFAWLSFNLPACSLKGRCHHKNKFTMYSLYMRRCVFINFLRASFGGIWFNASYLLILVCPMAAYRRREISQKWAWFHFFSKPLLKELKQIRCKKFWKPSSHIQKVLIETNSSQKLFIWWCYFF